MMTKLRVYSALGASLLPVSVAAAGIITGVVRCSPLNSVLGINNCK